MQKVTDQSKMDQISTFLERIDEDRDGQLKVDDVLKVIFGVINLIHFMNHHFKSDASKCVNLNFVADLRNNWKGEYQIECKAS